MLPASLYYLYLIHTLEPKLPSESYHFLNVDNMATIAIIAYSALLIGAPIHQKDEFLNDMHCLFKTQSCNHEKYRLDNTDK